MKSFAAAITILLALHFLAGVGFAGWLYGTGRLDRDRWERVVELFSPTIAEEARLAEEAAKLEAEARAVAERAARLEAVADGPQTLTDRLAFEERADEFAIHRIERLQRETDDLRGQVERAKEMLAEQKAQLDAEREAFDSFVSETTEKMKAEDFQHAVQVYEQLKPRQSKQMLEQLLAEGKSDEVVDYLAAMQLRKAAAVLKEFKTPAEIATAATLIESLAARGVYPVSGAAATEATP